MREIQLTRRQVAQVDDADYDWLNRYTWRALWSHTSHAFYAIRVTSRKDGRKTILMHREILGLPPGDPRRGDHKETGDTLNNQRSNLRIASSSQNSCNCRKRGHNTSGFKGVSLRKSVGNYLVQIVVGGVHHYLGTFPTAEEGHKVYCEAAKRLHGEFARSA